MADLIDINTLFGPLPTSSSDLSVEDLLALMQKHQVTRACTMSTLGSLFDSSIGNAATRAACSEHNELIAAATLNPRSFMGDTEQIGALPEAGYKIVRFFPDEQQWPIDYAPFRALLRVLVESKLPIMIRVEKLGEITGLMRALELYEAPVILESVDIPLLSEAVAALHSNKHWCLETSNLLATGAIQLVAETVGAERVLFGTSAPFHPIAGVLNMIRLAGFNDTETEQVLSGNARRILKV